MWFVQDNCDVRGGAGIVRDREESTMRLTTKGRFAVTAMIDVAMHGGAGP